MLVFLSTSPLRRYGNRMDAVWSFRSAYNEARKVKNAQDAYCAKAEAGQWDAIQGQSFPKSLQWEALVDVLRGRVKVRTVPLMLRDDTLRDADLKPLLRSSRPRRHRPGWCILSSS